MATTLIVTNDFPPRVGGIESFVSEVCGLLDHDVVVLTSGPSGAERGDRDRPYTVVRAGSTLLPTRRVRDLAVGLLQQQGCTRVVFGAAAPLGLLAPALRRAGATDIVGLTHGHEVWWATVPGARRLLCRIGDGCDHLTTISDYTAGRIGAALAPQAAARLLRLAPPVDTDIFRPAPEGRRAGPPRCVAVGRFVPQKGFATLLHAWRRVLDRTGRVEADAEADAELVLVGDGPQRPRLQAMIRDLSLYQTVRLTGALGRDGVVGELRQADVFALPVTTRLVGLNPEGLGLAGLEAAACGLPVLIGRSGGAPETVRSGVTGFVLDPGDVEGWSDRIGALLDDPARARAMGLEGRRLVLGQFGLDAARDTLRTALRLG